MAQDPNFAVMAKIRRLLAESLAEFQKLPPEQQAALQGAEENSPQGGILTRLESAHAGSEHVCQLIEAGVLPGAVSRGPSVGM